MNDAQTQCPECGAQLIVNLRGHRQFTCGREDVYDRPSPSVYDRGLSDARIVLEVIEPCRNVEIAAAMLVEE